MFSKFQMTYVIYAKDSCNTSKLFQDKSEFFPRKEVQTTFSMAALRDKMQAKEKGKVMLCSKYKAYLI